MSKLKNELQRKIAEHLFNETQIDNKIQDTVEGGIASSIDYSSEDADHKKPPNIPADSLIKMKQAEFDPIDDFTKLRRKVYRKIGKDSQDKREAMKDKSISMTKVSKSLDDTTIKIKIENHSPLLTYLRSGFLGETARQDSEALKREAGFIMAQSLELGLGGDSDLQEYVQQLLDLANGGGTLGKIPIRDVLRASVELIGKDFIRDNIL